MQRELQHRLLAFVNHLPPSDIRLVSYILNDNGTLDRYAKDTLHLWQLHDQVLYLTYDRNNQLYVYPSSTIQDLVIHRTPDIGRYLTISLLLTHDHRWLLKACKKVYIEKLEPNCEFDESRFTRSFNINNPHDIVIDVKTLQVEYYNDPIWMHVIQQIVNVLNAPPLPQGIRTYKPLDDSCIQKYVRDNLPQHRTDLLTIRVFHKETDDTIAILYEFDYDAVQLRTITTN